jgi:hypothetical protein
VQIKKKKNFPLTKGFGSWDRANEAANAHIYKDKWKSPCAGLSLGADVNPSNFQEA